MPDIFLAEALIPYGGAFFHVLIRLAQPNPEEVIAISAISIAW